MDTTNLFRATTLALAGATAVAIAIDLADALVVGTAAQVVTAPGPGLPLSTFATADFSGSGTCAVCHSGLKDQAGADVSIDAHWRASMMAQSARDPLWQAKVSSEGARAPALREVVEDKCATCHMPMARTQADVLGSRAAVLGAGFVDPAHGLHAAAMDGVSCTLCHQVRSEGLGEFASFTGGYRIDAATTAPDRLAFGPFPAPFQGPMRGSTGYTPVEGPHVRDSALCATCHTLYTPTVDATGQVVGRLPEQTPFLEWRHSAWGDGAGEDRSCQQCHMPEARGAVVISNRPGGRQLLPRQPFMQHQFLGANAFMLDLLAAHVGNLRLTVSPDLLAARAAATRAYLERSAAQLAIAGERTEGETLRLDIEVRSLTGHKFPTGFPSRRAWLHVSVADAAGRVVFESGRPEADGRIAGNDADERADGVEPHHERIVSPEQVQIYEAIMLDTDGAPTYTLLRGARYGKDNRLLPAGFLAATAPADVAVAGAAALDRDFDAGGDRVQYAVPVAGSAGPFTVRAELLYQTVSFRFVADLLTTPTAEAGRFAALHAAAEKRPAPVASGVAIVH
jgi:hypothetical protein